MPIKCPQARAAYQKAYMRRRCAEEPEFLARQNERKKKNKLVYATQVRELIAKFKASGCIVCGESDPAALDAHHLDPATKEFNIGQLDRSSPASYLKEMAKCVCLCANCHRKLHAGRFELEPRHLIR